GDHVEHRGLAGAVGAEQTDCLAAADIEADPTHDPAAPEAFFNAVYRKVVAGLLTMVHAAGCAPGLTGGGGRWGDLRVGSPPPHPALPPLHRNASLSPPPFPG